MAYASYLVESRSAALDKIRSFLAANPAQGWVMMYEHSQNDAKFVIENPSIPMAMGISLGSYDWHNYHSNLFVGTAFTPSASWPPKMENGSGFRPSLFNNFWPATLHIIMTPRSFHIVIQRQDNQLYCWAIGGGICTDRYAPVPNVNCIYGSTPSRGATSNAPRGNFLTQSTSDVTTTIIIDSTRKINYVTNGLDAIAPFPNRYGKTLATYPPAVFQSLYKKDSKTSIFLPVIIPAKADIEGYAPRFELEDIRATSIVGQFAGAIVQYQGEPWILFPQHGGESAGGGPSRYAEYEAQAVAFRLERGDA
uniref:hypothetical protein n=1 Tax=Thaumasiovibrio occultus TaxID=1891184 RepID=UPI000B3576AC|nr:hypothetical protein [Thaumasiovibrio occultus]